MEDLKSDKWTASAGMGRNARLHVSLGREREVINIDGSLGAIVNDF